MTLPDYSSYTIGVVLLYAACGIFGLLMRLAALDIGLRLPTYKDHELKLNVLGELILAVGTAVLANHNLLIATTAAAGAPIIAAAVLKWLPEFIRRNEP